MTQLIDQRASRPPVPIALGSAGPSSEEGRAFFQSRLTLFGGWVFLVSGAFYLVSASQQTAYGVDATTASLFHLAGTLVAGAIWAAGRWTRLSAAAVRALDALGTWLLCASFALMAGAFAVPHLDAGLDPLHALFIGLLACSYVLFSRAIAVPSTPGRTVTVSALAMLPMLGVIYWVFAQPGGGATMPTGYFDTVSWAVAAVVMAGISSRVIFGLRAEVSKIRQLGQYTLVEKIGEGGMGVVYRARHALLRRPTAIKLLSPEKAGEENLLRFEREVQLTAGLSHPSTVAVFDYGRTPEGVFYYAMEYLDGLNLERLVTEHGRQPRGRVVHILRQVCGALAEAHGVGLVHRDIKPANIILCERGAMPDVAKVVDFGLVKRFEPSSTDATMLVTAAHTFMGTPLYLPPEALRGDGIVGARSDLYALGAVGYFLLTGTPVFFGSSTVEVCAHHLHTVPEPPSERAGIRLPPELDRIILQCLAKSPSDRPADVRALKRALESCPPDAAWSAADAERWWVRFREVNGPSATAVDPEERERATIDAG